MEDAGGRVLCERGIQGGDYGPHGAAFLGGVMVGVSQVRLVCIFLATSLLQLVYLHLLCMF